MYMCKVHAGVHAYIMDVLHAVQVGTSSLPTYLDLSVCRDGVVVFGGEQSNDRHLQSQGGGGTVHYIHC